MSAVRFLDARSLMWSSFLLISLTGPLTSDACQDIVVISASHPTSSSMHCNFVLCRTFSSLSHIVWLLMLRLMPCNACIHTPSTPRRCNLCCTSLVFYISARCLYIALSTPLRSQFAALPPRVFEPGKRL